jgi:hypothetical protein
VLNDPASLLKSQSRIVSFECCQIWFCGDQVVLDSLVALPDLQLREFARPRITFGDACYYLSERSQSGARPVVYRYVLSPWPKNDQSVTRSIVLDADYFQEIMARRRRARLENVAFKALVVLYPFLGFLWSPQKRALNRIGFESHSISSMSAYTGFVIGFSFGVFLVIFEFGTKSFSATLAMGMVAFMVDAVARFDRLLAGKDQIPPGFFEWLVRRKGSYE